MSTSHFCKSMIIYPIHQLKKGRNNVQDFNSKTNKNANSFLVNTEINKEDSYRKKDLIIMSNDFYTNNKNNADVKFPEIRFRKNLKNKSKYKKITLFSTEKHKLYIRNDNNKKKKIRVLNSPIFKNKQNHIKTKLTGIVEVF